MKTFQLIDESKTPPTRLSRRVEQFPAKWTQGSEDQSPPTPPEPYAYVEILPRPAKGDGYNEATQKVVDDVTTTADGWKIVDLDPVTITAETSVACEALQLALVFFGGTVSQIDSIIAGLDDPFRELAAIRWSNLAGQIERGHQFVALVTDGLEWSPEKIDKLFLLALKLDGDREYVPTVEDLSP